MEIPGKGAKGAHRIAIGSLLGHGDDKFLFPV